MVDFGLHLLGQNLLAHRFVELRLPLGHGLAVLRFERLHRAKHLHVVRQAAVDFAEDFGVGDLEAVEACVVQQQLFEEHGFEQAAFVVFGDGAALEFGLGHAVPDVTREHDFVSDHGHNAVKALVGRLRSGLRPSEGREEAGKKRKDQSCVNHGSNLGVASVQTHGAGGQELTNFLDANPPPPRRAEAGCREGLRAAVDGASEAGAR